MPRVVLAPPPSLPSTAAVGGDALNGVVALAEPDAAAAIPWESIVTAAQAGVSERSIMDAYHLDEQTLRDLGALDRFRIEVRAGNAYKEMSLRVEIDQRGKRSRKNAGSVNILALEARNVLNWDRQKQPQELQPDLTTAKDRLRATLDKLAEQRTEIEGIPVTPAMILCREAGHDVAGVGAIALSGTDTLVHGGAGR